MKIHVPAPPRRPAQPAPPTPGGSAKPGGAPLRRAGCAVFGVVLAAVGIFYGVMVFTSSYSELRAIGPVVHVSAAAPETEGRVILLTGQWETILNRTGRTTSTWSTRTYLLIDLWAVSDRDGRTLWRRRLQKIRDGGILGRRIVGAQDGVVWLVIEGQLIAADVATGDIVAKAGHIEAANPALEDLMPSDDRFYEFDGAGLWMLAADGRYWRIDPKDFVAKEASKDAPAEPNPGAHPPAFYTPLATALFQARNIDIPNRWLGLLTDAEAEFIAENNTIGGLVPTERTRLWSAAGFKDEARFGDLTRFADFRPLPASPEFLNGGLLAPFRSGENVPALWLTEPDSVLVLHRERIGNDGGLRLARIAGPEGNTVWEADLPLTVLQSVMTSEASILLFGQDFPRDDGTDRGDPYHSSPERLVIIDKATGAQHVHDHAAVDTLPEAVDVDTGL